MRFSRKDKHGLAIMGLAGVIIIGLLVAQFAIAPLPTDKKTLCPKSDDAQYSQVFLLVDNTDKLTARRQTDLRRELRNVANNLELGERLTVYEISSERNGLSLPVFDMCRPTRGEEVSAWTSAPKQAEKKYKESFERLLEELLSGFSEQIGSPTSPILESFADLSKQLRIIDGSRTEVRVYIFSDLMHNTDGYSQYGRGATLDFDAWKKTPYGIRTGANFRNYPVTVLYLINSAITRPVEHREFWLKYFNAAEAEYTWEPLQ